jgi:hypothetical protein
MKKSPIQVVKEKYGNKSDLVAKVMPLLSVPEGESIEEFTARITKASNRQLLRLLASEERVRKDFESKDGLVAAIVKFKFPFKGNPAYAAKLSRFTSSRLLDLHDSLRKAAARA